MLTASDYVRLFVRTSTVSIWLGVIPWHGFCLFSLISFPHYKLQFREPFHRERQEPVQGSRVILGICKEEMMAEGLGDFRS